MTIETMTTWRCRLFGHSKERVPFKPGYGPRYGAWERPWRCTRAGCDAHHDGFRYPPRPPYPLAPNVRTGGRGAYVGAPLHMPAKEEDDELMTGLVVGAVLDSLSASDDTQPSPEPYSGGGGTFDGGGASADFGGSDSSSDGGGSSE